VLVDNEWYGEEELEKGIDTDRSDCMLLCGLNVDDVGRMDSYISLS
jgi:hypothetical protein